MISLPAMRSLTTSANPGGAPADLPVRRACLRPRPTNYAATCRDEAAPFAQAAAPLGPAFSASQEGLAAPAILQAGARRSPRAKTRSARPTAAGKGRPTPDFHEPPVALRA
jgi:hypothetical protein